MADGKVETEKCAYCGQVRPKSEMKEGKIISRQYRNFEKINWYCNDKPCHGYDQMAHEG